MKGRDAVCAGLRAFPCCTQLFRTFSTPRTGPTLRSEGVRLTTIQEISAIYILLPIQLIFAIACL